MTPLEPQMEPNDARVSARLRGLSRHPVIRNAFSLYGIQVAGYLLPLLTYPYLARVLHAEKLGLIAFAQALTMYFVVLTEYGFGFSATRLIAIRRDDRREVSRIFTAVLAAKGLLTLASLVLLTVIVFAVPKLRLNWPLYYIAFMTVIGGAVFPIWLYQGLEQMQYITVREIGARILALLPLFVLVRHESDFLTAAAIQSGSMVLAGFAGLAITPRATGVRFVRISARDVWEMLSDGWHIFLSTAAITLYTSTNTFVLGLVALPRDVGLFSVAQRIVDSAKSLVFPMSTAVYPHISHMAANSPELAVSFVRRNLLKLTAPFILLSAVLFIGAPFIVRIVGGPAFAEAAPLLRILSPIPCIVGLGTGYATYFMLGLGYKKEWSRMIIQAGVLNLVLLGTLLLLVRPTIAAAVTAGVAELFVLVRSYAFYRQKTR